jgi:hypothetical protein
VHWIDPSSRDLLGFLVQNARRDRLAVVATYRTDELRRGDPLRLFFGPNLPGAPVRMFALSPPARPGGPQ